MHHIVARRVQFGTALVQSMDGITASQWTCRAPARDTEKANSYQSFVTIRNMTSGAIDSRQPRSSPVTLHTRIGVVSDLGVKVQWRFRFMGPGVQVTPATDILWIDTGGKCTHGVIDHHGANQATTCAAKLVIDHADLVHEHLVAPWIIAARSTAVRDQQWSPTLVTHFSPDFDAIAASLLAIELVEHGGMPLWGPALSDYALEVDQGRTSCRKKSATQVEPDLHMLILMISNLKPNDASVLWKIVRESPILGRFGYESSENVGEHVAVLLSGIALMHEACHRAYSGWTRLESFARRVCAVVDDMADAPAWFRNAVKLLHDEVNVDFCTFIDNDQPNIVECEVRLPQVSGGARLSCAAIVVNQPHSKCDKYFIRALGKSGRRTEFTVIAKEQPKEVDGIPRHRTIVSVDPGYALAEGLEPVNLAGLGVTIERAEQRARKDKKNSDSKRRGPARFLEIPGISDPWYDGRDHEFTIIDGPRDPSVLSASEIAELAKQPFWEPAMDGAKHWTRQVADVMMSEDLPFGAGMSIAGARLAVAVSSHAELSFNIVTGAVDHSWGDRAIRVAIASICGDDYKTIALPAMSIHCGARGAVVDAQRSDAKSPGVSAIDPRTQSVCAAIDEEWQRVQRLVMVGSNAARGGKLAPLKRVLLHLSQDPRAQSQRSSTGASPSHLALRETCWKVFHTHRLIESTSRMLDQRDEIEQRAVAAAINWTVVTLAVVGAIQTIVAVADYQLQGLGASQMGTVIDGIASWGGMAVFLSVLLGLSVAWIRYRSISRSGWGDCRDSWRLSSCVGACRSFVRRMIHGQ